VNSWSAEQKNNGNVPHIHGEDKIVVPRAGLEPATSGDITRKLPLFCDSLLLRLIEHL